MFLYKGYYYLDNKHKKPLTSEIFDKFKNEGVLRMNGLEYTVIFNCNLIDIIIQKKTISLFQEPKKIKFPDNELIDIYSLEQLKELLTEHRIDFPLYNDKILSFEELKDKLGSIKEIKNFDFNVIFNETIILEQKINDQEQFTYEDLSKYIKLYLKTDVIKDSNKFIENKFITIPELEPNLKFNYYEDKDRNSFNPKNKFLNSKYKEIFLTGPHGIGKTFTLLYLSINEKFRKKKIEKELKKKISEKKSNKRILKDELDQLIKREDINTAYFNLEILSTNKDSFKIIIYETRYLFDSYEEYKNFYKELYDQIHGEDFLLFIYIIFKEFSKKQKNKKIFIIFDQFKYKNDDDLLKFDNIRNLVSGSSDLYLIFCSSLNYKGVKASLINYAEISLNNSKIPYFFYFNKLINNKNKFNNNIFLQKLGYLPRYCEINDLLSNKILNIIKKRIKIKVKKFYDNNEYKMVKEIENFKNNIEKELNSNTFNDILNNFPIKYLDINFNDKVFKYLYPLVETAMDELVYSFKIRQISNINNSEKGWKFESILFDYISNNNSIFNYYIDQFFKIDTIFHPEKLPNEFNINENSLITFNYYNVARYNGIIYLGKEEKLIFIQASIHKPEEKLKKYNKKNFEKNIIKIQPFLRVNKLEPKKYYLLFIYDLETYTKNSSYENVINNYHFQYIYFSMQQLLFNYFNHKDFTYELNPPKNLSTINNKLKIKRQIKFIKSSNFSTIPQDYIGPKYFIYYSCTFSSFMKKIFEDFVEIEKNFIYNKKEYIFKFFETIDDKKKNEI